jgi:signal transduction histidine kinase
MSDRFGGQDMFLFLLGTRWLALLPPLLALFDRDQTLWRQILFGLALTANIVISILYPRFNRWMTRYPVILLLDMALMALLLWGTDGTNSAYVFYAVSPLLAAAFFFQIRGGLIATTIFIPFYLLAVVGAGMRDPRYFDSIDASVQIVVFVGIAVLMGFPSMLLQRLRETNNELQRAQEDLSRAQTLAALGGMIAHVSHEIRNPLTTLGGYAHQLVRKPNNPETVQHHAQIMASEVRRLEELLNDMLDLSRPKHRERQAINLNELLDRACLLAGDLESAKITINKQYERIAPTMLADESALLRAWINIIRNAMQAMPEGGTLTLHTHCTGNGVEVSITDTGQGIAPEKLPTIWQPFVTHREGGTGLGLAVTQQIIREHEGEIRVESEVGRGTKFTFSFPAVCNLPATNSGSEDETSDTGRGE